MRLGLIARAESRGLGYQTQAVHDHLRPDRTLVLDLGPNAKGHALHLDRYPGAQVVRLEGMQIPEAVARDFLAAVDVVYSAETVYDYRLLEWARQEGTAVVIHANPELWQWARVPSLPHPTAWWVPTSWRLERMPPGTRVVPLPVSTAGLAPKRRRRAGTLVHVAGVQAVWDRNGTGVLLDALSMVKRPTHVRLYAQDGRRWKLRVPTHVTVDQAGEVSDRDDLYRDADVLVMPRRYGGLCMPVQEAMARGLAVVMPNCAPNSTTWPVLTTPGAYDRQVLHAPGGDIPMFRPDPWRLAEALDRLHDEPETVWEFSGLSLDWATEHSWAALAPVWREEFARAIDTLRCRGVHSAQ